MGRNATLDARSMVRRGRRLAEEKKRCFDVGKTWRSYVKDNLDISRERADELIRIGLGLVSVEAARASKRERQQASRAKKAAPYAKVLLLNHAARVDEACSSLRERISRLRVPRGETEAMREAICEAIASWEGLLREVDAIANRECQ